NNFNIKVRITRRIVMNQNNAIEIRDMHKYFKLVFDKPQTLKERLVFWNKAKPEYHEVLKDINIDIKKGETVALIGTNGSGKSTLLKLMTKILYPNKGTIETNGKLTSLLELGAGFHPDFTGRENIYFNASIFGLTRQEIDKRIDQIIEFSELGTFIDNPVRTYSSGMYMRLAFSVAINVDAEILLIDEILSVGDQHFQDKCFNKLKELSQSEKTIVIVSHSLGQIEQLCSRAIWVFQGEIKEDGNAKDVINKYLKVCQ
ncbi:ABC transporter ATP-binding protein, partial [Thomasclavelia cocleata]